MPGSHPHSVLRDPLEDSGRILVFGTFDQFHPGHDFFLREAKKYGNYLAVVVAQDATVKQQKGRNPVESSIRRLANVLAHPAVDEGRLGDKKPADYTVLGQARFAIVVVGYDQVPSDEGIQGLLHEAGKRHVKVVRLPAFHPTKYKSSIVRDKMKK